MQQPPKTSIPCPDQPEYHSDDPENAKLLEEVRSLEYKLSQLAFTDPTDVQSMIVCMHVMDLERIVHEYFAKPTERSAALLALDVLLQCAEDESRTSYCRCLAINRLVRASMLTFSNDAYPRRRDLVLRIAAVFAREKQADVRTEAQELLVHYFALLKMWQSDGALPDDMLDTAFHQELTRLLMSSIPNSPDPVVQAAKVADIAEAAHSLGILPDLK